MTDSGPRPEGSGGSGAGSGGLFGNGGGPSTGSQGGTGSGGYPEVIPGGSGGSSEQNFDAGDAEVQTRDAGIDGARSPTALCVGTQGPLEALDVWSDSRGPFVVATTPSYGLEILQKSGDLWTNVYEQPTGGALGHIRGFSGGDLLLYGTGCGITRIHAGTSHCESGFGGGVTDIFVVSGDLAYAVESDRALIYDGSAWTQLGEPLGASNGSAIFGWRIWGDDRTVLVTATSGEVFISQTGGAWKEQSELQQDAYRVVWGFNSESIWIGGRSGALLSYDGTTWQKRAQVTDKCGGGVRGMWGKDDTLYVYTEHGLTEWSAGELHPLKQFPCTTTIRGMWGTSLSEVYIVTTDDLEQSTRCGSAHLFSVAGVVTSL